MNWIIDLTNPGNWLESSDLDLPNAIHQLYLGALTAVSLPNASLCADFLYSYEYKGIVGVAIEVAEQDKTHISRWFRYCHSSVAQWRGSKLYIRWQPCDDVIVREAQSDGVLWFTVPALDSSAQIKAVVLEDILYIEREAQSSLVPPCKGKLMK